MEDNYLKLYLENKKKDEKSGLKFRVCSVFKEGGGDVLANISNAWPSNVNVKKSNVHLFDACYFLCAQLRCS